MGGIYIIYDFFFPVKEEFARGGQDFFEIYIVPFLCIPIAIMGTIMLRWLLARIMPNPVKIIAVEIDRVIPVWPEATVYHFRGGTIEELAMTPPRRDENLTFLKLNKREKNELLSRLRTEQMALTKDPNRLNTIIKAIGASRRLFGRKNKKIMRKDKIS